MGILRKGILGEVKGRVGPVEGSTSRGIHTIKARRRKTRKKPVEAQVEQRSKFGILSAFLSIILPLLNVGFKKRKKEFSPYDLAMRVNLINGLTEGENGFEINYEKIALSSGSGETAWSARMAYEETTRKLTISWEIPETVSLSLGSDLAYFLIYNQKLQLPIALEAVTVRAAQQYELVLPKHFARKIIHVWMFFASEEGKILSNSDYVGKLDIPTSSQSVALT